MWQLLLFIVVFILLAFLFVKEFAFGVSPVEKTPSVVKTNNEEAKAANALEDSKLALLQAQQSDSTFPLQELSRYVSSIEAELSTVQARAILSPLDTTIVKEARTVELEAKDARIELENQWKESLTTATNAMEKAELAASEATNAYLSAKSKITYWLDKMNYANLAVQKFNSLIQATDSPIMRATYEGELYRYREKWNYYLQEYNKAVAAADRIKLNAATTITNANLTVERVLTITADLRLLNLLLSLASRTDEIAIATRTKLGELERKLLEG